MLFVALVVAVSIVLTWVWAALRGYRARLQPLPAFSLHGTPSVSILVPAWNERTILSRCIASLQRVEYPARECIIIAGGEDNTFEYARALVVDDGRFNVISQRAGGKNAALNDGLRVAHGNIIVLLDADCEVEPGWLGALVAPLTERADAAAGNYFPDAVTPISLQFQMDKTSTYFVQRAAMLHGGAIALSRAALDRLGGSFPESVLVGTDWDLNARLERLGCPKVFVAEARHTTPLPATWQHFAQNEIRWRRAHFLATLRFSRQTVTDWITCLQGLMPYLGASLLASIFIALPILHFVQPSLGSYFARGWVAYLIWLLGRRIGQVIEVAAYENDLRWLKLFWVPPATTAVSLGCCLIALISLRHLSAHFKGHRPPSVVENLRG